MSDEVYFGHVQPGMPKVPKISLHIFAISPEKHRGGGEVDILPAIKYKYFLQVDSIILCLHVGACLRPSIVKASSVWNSWDCQGTDQ